MSNFGLILQLFLEIDIFISLYVKSCGLFIFIKSDIALYIMSYFSKLNIELFLLLALSFFKRLK